MQKVKSNILHMDPIKRLLQMKQGGMEQNDTQVFTTTKIIIYFKLRFYIERVFTLIINTSILYLPLC